MKRSLLKAASLAALVGVAAVAALPVLAQTPAAKSAATMPIKRTADGKPDLSGSWTFRIAPPPRQDARGICAGPRCGGGAEAAGLDPGAPAPAAAAAAPAGPRVQFPKYKPEFAEKIAKLNKEQVNTDPALRCQNPGIPRVGTPDKIIQTADQIVFLYEDLNGAFWRVIPTDGRPHRTDAEEGPFGDSVGRWEGDTLVIETNNLGEDTWLTDNGAFHTYNLKTVEEVKLTADGKLDYKLTSHDPEVLAEPFVKQRTLVRNTREPLQPPPCVERSIDKMVGIESYHPNPRW
ncbi:MAG TPA: hypothetical protein VIA80_05275 [Hyphomonadaceae bacterium]|jgi:hypothetical protein